MKCVKVHVDIDGLDEIRKKVEEASECIEKARSILNDLADSEMTLTLDPRLEGETISTEVADVLTETSAD